MTNNLAGLKKKTTCMSAIAVAMRAMYMSRHGTLNGLQPVVPKIAKQAMALGIMQGLSLAVRHLVGAVGCRLAQEGLSCDMITLKFIYQLQARMIASGLPH